MSDIHPGAASIENDKGASLVAEATSLRRKLLFWRRAVMLVLSMAVIMALVAWQRMSIRAHECEHALLHYAELAKSANLELGLPETFDTRWQRLSKESETVGPDHYLPIVQDWMQRPVPGRPPLPLAICRDSHVVMFTRGRYVLYRDDKSMFVKWLPEEQAAPILQRARPENP